MLSSSALTFVCCCADMAHGVLTLQSAASCSGCKIELLCDIPVNDCALLMVLGDMYAGGGPPAAAQSRDC